MDTTNGQLQNVKDILFGQYFPQWHMSVAERCTLITMLDALKPECAIEIGTAQGGSLSALAHFSKKVYTLDVDPTCRERLEAHFSNVEFVSGNSEHTLPLLLQHLQATDTRPGFILVDGDHSRHGVQRDIENIIKYRPLQPLYVVLHDSFNPECRQGILEANWAMSPYVHSVELDFVPGAFLSRPERYREMWGGLAVAQLYPHERQQALIIQTDGELLFRTVKERFINHRRIDHRTRRLLSRLRDKSFSHH